MKAAGAESLSKSAGMMAASFTSRKTLSHLAGHWENKLRIRDTILHEPLRFLADTATAERVEFKTNASNVIWLSRIEGFQTVNPDRPPLRSMPLGRKTRPTLVRSPFR
jgi:hypothetical protein